MLILVTVLHVLLCIFMIFVILLQPGKDAGMGSALGGGSATTVFGGRGAVTFLGKVTSAFAILYFLTSLGLSFVGLKKSVIEGAEIPAAPAAAAPVAPVEPPKAEAAPKDAVPAPAPDPTPAQPMP